MTVVFHTASTLNGYLASPDHSLSWLFEVPGDEPDMAPFIASATVFIMGSHTYEWLLREENFLEHPEKWQTFYGTRPTYVFSSRDLAAVPGADLRFVSGDVAEALPEIRAAGGEGPLWVIGGGDLAGQFLDADALDEIVVAFAPALLRDGAPLLPRDLRAERLTLTGVERVGQYAMLSYRVRPSSAAA